MAAPAIDVIVGLDEAGRGPLAGPVVAGACHIPPTVQRIPRIICDSKALTSAEREEGFRWIERRCVFGFGIVPHAMIDAFGILEATERAMHRALAMLSRRIRPTFLLIDGRDGFWFDLPHATIVRGDATERCISAASIVAKVIRDRLMVRHDAIFPGYGFARHKGYGTPEHWKMLRKFGPCSVHRRTFLDHRIPLS